MTDQTRRPTTPEVWSAGPRWAHLVVLGTVLLTYGFELFNFNVSADEPLYWNAERSDMARVWGWQGRWGMALTAWLLPSTDIPVVPLAIGLASATCALWWLGRSILQLGEWESVFATSMAISLPTLAFHFSFTINSLGLGLAYAACAASAFLVIRGGWPSLVGAALMGAYAIGVYEGFAFVLMTVYLALVWRSGRWSTARLTAAVALAAAAVWFALSKISSATVPVEHSGYVKDILSLGAIAADPMGRLAYAVSRTLGMVLQRSLYFGYTNPLPALVMGVVFIAAMVAAWRRPRPERLLAILVVFGVVLIPLIAAFSTRVLFQRSLVYLPVTVVVLAGVGLPVLRYVAHRAVRWLAMMVAVAAIAGNATLANGAFYSGTVMTDEDIIVASNIAANYRSLGGDIDSPVPTVVSPRTVDTFRPDSWAGRSTFELGVMNTPRGAVKFLQMRGLNVSEPTASEIERATAALAQMPAYPAAGYLKVSGGLLLINLASVPGR